MYKQLNSNFRVSLFEDRFIYDKGKLNSIRQKLYSLHTYFATKIGNICSIIRGIHRTQQACLWIVLLLTKSVHFVYRRDEVEICYTKND